MKPQEFVDWGRRIADGYAISASQGDTYAKGHEFDSDSMNADEFLNRSNEVARAFTVPGGEARVAFELLHVSPGTEEEFKQAYQELLPVLNDIFEGMWTGEWQFNDSGLIGTLKIGREKTVYVDSQGTTHETEFATTDEEYGMSYESRHIEVKYPAYPPWKIHAFIFRWDRLKMAGVVEHGETEGKHSFYAVKMAIPRPER